MKYLLVGLSLLMSTTAWSATFFYRVVMKKPIDVFLQGFVPWGQNDNVADHVSGRSCTLAEGTPNSAFVSTFGSSGPAEAYAAGIASSLLRGEEVSLYTIRGTSNFYNAVASLRAGGNPPAILVQAATADDEWIAFNGIDATQIVAASTYLRLPDDSLQHTVISNDGYVEVESSPNQEPYVSAATAVGWRVYETEIRDAIRAGIVQRNLHSACLEGKYSNGSAWRGGIDDDTNGPLY